MKEWMKNKKPKTKHTLKCTFCTFSVCTKGIAFGNPSYSINRFLQIATAVSTATCTRVDPLNSNNAFKWSALFVALSLHFDLHWQLYLLSSFDSSGFYLKTTSVCQFVVLYGAKDSIFQWILWAMLFVSFFHP